MAEFKSPAAVIYTFEDPIPESTDGTSLTTPIPLFTRVGVPKDIYPDWLKSDLTPSQYDPETGAVLEGSTAVNPNWSDQWVLVSAKVSITRFWACSTATFTLALPLEDPDIELPMAPIHPEMPIAIALGYEDLNGSIMFNIPSKELHRVFTGYVDTISYKLTNKQVLCVVACRDSIRFLVDNKLNRVFTDKNLTTQGLDISGDRTRVIKDLVIQGCGVYDNGVAPLNTARIPLTQSTNFPDEPYWDPTDRPELGLTRPSDLKQGEAGLAEQATTHQLLNVMGKFPIEVIKHLSSIEGKPREFYSDRWGNIIWAIRKTNKLTQPWDFYFRNPVAIGNSSGTFPMISGSTEWSTVGTMTEFIVMNPTTGSGEVAGGAFAIQGTLKTRTALGFDMARRSRFIFDDTLDNSDTNISGLEAPFLAAMLSLHGKDVRAGSAEIEGLPEILPGDAVRVWGIGLYPPPHNLFRAEAIIHSYNGMGAKKGFRTNIMYAEIQESLESMTDRIDKDDAVKAVTYNQAVAKPGEAVAKKPEPAKPPEPANTKKTQSNQTTPPKSQAEIEALAAEKQRKDEEEAKEKAKTQKPAPTDPRINMQGYDPNIPRIYRAFISITGIIPKESFPHTAETLAVWLSNRRPVFDKLVQNGFEYPGYPGDDREFTFYAKTKEKITFDQAKAILTLMNFPERSVILAANGP